MIELQKLTYYETQRDNAVNPGTTCLATSCAMAIEYISQKSYGGALEYKIVRHCQLLTESEKAALTKKEGTWIWQHSPWTVLPIMEYVLNEYYLPCSVSWGISLETVKAAIENNKPVVCLGDFSSVSKIGGHYNCVIGVDTDTVKTLDPWGDARTNYIETNGQGMIYPWSIFDRGYGKSYGITF